MASLLARGEGKARSASDDRGPEVSNASNALKNTDLKTKPARRSRASDPAGMSGRLRPAHPCARCTDFGYAADHLTIFRSSTHVAYSTGTRISVTNVAIVKPP